MIREITMLVNHKEHRLTRQGAGTRRGVNIVSKFARPVSAWAQRGTPWLTPEATWEYLQARAQKSPLTDRLWVPTEGKPMEDSNWIQVASKVKYGRTRSPKPVPPADEPG